MRIVILVVVLLSACNWRYVERVDQVVWSDDDTQQAYVVQRYEERTAYPLNGTKYRRNFRHQVFVQNADGTERAPLTGDRLFQNGLNLYYMRRAGYVLLDVQLSETVTRYDVIRLDGKAQTLLTYRRDSDLCASLEVVPSPDGQTIAVVQSQSTGTPSAGSLCAASVTARFYAAADLRLVSEMTWPIQDRISSTWLLSGELLIWAKQQAWRVKDGGPVAASIPRCGYPKTTSSVISESGVMIVPTEIFGSEPVEKLAGSDNPVFGCQ